MHHGKIINIHIGYWITIIIGRCIGVSDNVVMESLFGSSYADSVSQNRILASFRYKGIGWFIRIFYNDIERKMKVLFLDNDGVICLSNNWGSRYKKARRYMIDHNIAEHDPNMYDPKKRAIEIRFDNFDDKAIKVLNEIIEATDAEIVVSSDWRLSANLEELGEYYTSQGICKKPIGFTKLLNECEQPENFPWFRVHDLEQSRSLEILQYLKDHPEITHWVAVDDLHMGVHVENSSYGAHDRDWGLTNFVWTPRSTEGIKQTGIKEKILKYLE